MQNKIIAIHQPNLFPWLGYFNKILRCDTFVFLDHVLMNPRTSIYPKKVNVISNKQEYTLTIPLKNRTGEVFQRIQDMEIEKPDIIGGKHLKTIEQNYKKAPYFGECFPLVLDYYQSSTNLISERNIQFIRSVVDKFGIDMSFVRTKDLDCKGTSTELLVEIVKAMKGSIYLSGDGAGGYQDQALYSDNNIELIFTEFKHPVYSQFNSKEFIKGLSIIDALMNCGFEGVKSLLHRGANTNKK